MKMPKNISKRYSEIMIALSAAAFGLLVQPTLGSYINPLFSNSSKALLIGFVLLSFILVIAITVAAVFIRSHDKQLIRFETNLVETKKQVKLSSSLSKVGISGAVSNHSETLFEEFCAEANNEIRILQTYLGSVQQLPNSVFSGMKRGVKVKVLLLDPNSSMIQQRLRDIGLPNSVQLHIDAMERLKVLFKRHDPPKETFEIRIHNGIPPFAFYSADRKIRIGFFWHGEHCPAGPHIFVDDNNSEIGKFAVKTFNEIWESATIVSIN